MKLPYGHRLLPKLFESLAKYNRRDFLADCVAGLTVGLVALPLAMAFAISSGVQPQAGLYTAIVAGFLVSMLGGSRCQVSGPTGAFVVIVAGIVGEFGVDGLLMCTMMAGVMLLVLGLTGMGSAVRYIPRPVTIGFTNGIAVLIASTQIKDFLGLTIEHVPGAFGERLVVLAKSLHTINITAAITAVASLAVIIFWPRLTKRVLGSIVAMVGATALCAIFGIGIETIGTQFGGIPTGLPAISIPDFRPDLVLPLVRPAMTVAMLAAIESLLSAVVADNMSGDRHKPDMELVAQGVANIIVPIFTGIPATGAIARTATNIRSGAKTPVAGMIHAVTLLVVLLVAAPLAQYIPLATLAAVLFVVAYNMSEWREIGTIARSSNAERAVWAATFALTVFADLTVAVEVGMLLAAVLYIYRVTDTTSVEPVTLEYIRDGQAHILQDKQIPPYVTVLRIHGPFLFGASAKLEEAAADLKHFNTVVVLRLRNMTALDGTGLHAIETVARRIRATGRHMVICGARRQPNRLVHHSELPHIIGHENIVPHIEKALERAKAISEDFSGMGKELARDFGGSAA